MPKPTLYNTTKSAHPVALLAQVSACVASPVPEALLRAQAENEYRAKLLELVQKGLARPQDVEEQLTEEGLEAFIDSE